ncbi:MAG: class I SAM-dependent methyltransferase [Acidobacteria bacterium]|nr:class I SAM-dependent methyltransferase [Acidobacteriota bacterium]
MSVINRVLEGFGPVKRLMPAGVKRAARQALLEQTLRRAVRKVAALPEGEAPSRELLAELLTGWSNDGFAADLDYLEEVARRAGRVEGHVLECGSGLTTLLVGLLAGRRGFETWSLEHHPEWHARVGAALAEHNVPRARLALAPLKSYGEFSWYDPPLAEMPDAFQLVVCDGPPWTTPGGRYGLLPVMHGRLPEGALVLLDDANRPEEQEALQRWSDEYGVTFEMRETGEGAYAVAACGGKK